MTPEEVIKRALAGEEVRYPTDISSLSRDRDALHKAALAGTSLPMEILTRTDPETYRPYFLVRHYKLLSVPYAQVEKEAREKGWIK